MLGHYYDLAQKDNFDKLFGRTWIGKHPTGEQNKFIILPFSFLSVYVDGDYQDIKNSFTQRCNQLISGLRDRYAPILDNMPEIVIDSPVANNLSNLIYYLQQNGLPSLYVTIDEYDNFANQLITTHRDILYNQLTMDGSFLKSFFKALKEGRERGVINNVFITGILPITIDELASAFNIGTYLTLDPEFENMLGFTQNDVEILLDDIYSEYKINSETRPEIEALLKNHYNGYHFVNPAGESLYNSTLLTYCLRWFESKGEVPPQLTDQNLKNDLSWVQRLTASNPEKTAVFINQLTLHNNIPYDKTYMTERLDMHQFFEESYFPISFYYLGMLTRKNAFYLQLPNLNMRQIFIGYFNAIHNIDVSTRYAPLMQRFIERPNLEELFTGYWEKYISQFPEAIFMQVNENFYRATFFELCSRYLSDWFIWNVERSYPQGKSDLEFIGKHHEKFAGLRWVIEFKYYSHTTFKKRFKTTIDNFQLQDKDTKQIAGYVEGLQQEYPKAQISQYVIYCIGHQGFRVFKV